jgi:exopolysaccharide biosynthesis polyprenyl glycosylphosphotransferase
MIDQLSGIVETSPWAKMQRASRSISRAAQWRLFIGALLISDVFMIGFGLRLAYNVRFNLNVALFHTEVVPSLDLYTRLVAVLIMLWVAIFALSGLYSQENLLGGANEYSLVFNRTTVGLFVIISVGFLDPSFIIARGWLILAWVFSFSLIILGRFLLRRVVYFLRRLGYFMAPTLVIGANNEGLELARQLQTYHTSGLHILGFVDEKLPAGTQVTPNLYILGRVDEMDDLVKRYQVEDLVLASSAISSHDKRVEIFERYGVASGVKVHMSSGFYEMITTGLRVKDIAFVPLVEVNQVRLTGVDFFLKTVLDYVLAIPLLLVVVPLYLILAIAIRLDSPGPAIHRRRVMGVNAKQFDAFKFRTMVVNGDELLDRNPELKAELARNHKLKVDPRITRVGAFLRKTSLDELPQIFNVLRGEMSLVGPRMITMPEMEKYNQWDINLLTVRPGITGLWQVSGRSDVTYEQRVQLDMHYIRNWSIWLDLQILYQTIPAVLLRRGAY